MIIGENTLTCAGYARTLLNVSRQKKHFKRAKSAIRTVADFNYDWEYWVDCEARFVYISPSCERITGFAAQEFMDDPKLLEKIVHPDDLTAVLSHFHVAKKANYHQDHKTLTSVSSVVMARLGGSDTRANRYTTNKASHWEGERRIETLPSARGLREELYLEKENLRDILDHMIDAVYIVNSQYEIQYMNPALRSERGDLGGRKCYEYLVGRSEPCPWCRNLEVVTGGSILWERTSDMTEKTYEIFETPIKNQDGSISALLILHDITERKSLQQQFLQAQKMEAIGTLAGGVAHDFNNVLQVALGYSDIMLDRRGIARTLSEPICRKINVSAKRGADLVQRLLTFSRKTEIKPSSLST